jgi:galactokinase
MTDYAAALAGAGMSDDEARAKAGIFARARQVLGGPSLGDAFAVFVPGRIEVLGKHTDYAGGRSLLCAAERGFCLVATPRDDRRIHLTDVVTGGRAETVLDPGPAAPAPGWGVYVTTVARRLARNFVEARRGADIAFGSDLPMAAGMSSSSALLTSAMLALSAINDLPATDTYRAAIRVNEDLAEYLGTIENGQDFGALEGDAGVGTFGGSEDHTAMLCCRPGELSQYRFCPVRHERQVPMPAGYRFVIGVSGIVAEKTGAARETYNRASLSARRVLEVWNAATGRTDATLRAAVESSPDAADRIRALLDDPEVRGRAESSSRGTHASNCGAEPSVHGAHPSVHGAPPSGRGAGLQPCLPPDLRARFDQFVDETFVIIPTVGDLLAAGRVEEIPELVERSQRGAERGLGNQVPETVFLADAARELGAVAGSAFGAGFGGGVWALVDADRLETFCVDWPDVYARAFPQHAARARFFTTAAGPAALRIA